jgi:hypothetical protein
VVRSGGIAQAVRWPLPGLNLSSDELDLIDAWFASPAAPQQRAARPQAPAQQPAAADPNLSGADRWWNAQQQGAPATATQPQQNDRFAAGGDDMGGDEFPRIVRRGLR